MVFYFFIMFTIFADLFYHIVFSRWCFTFPRPFVACSFLDGVWLSLCALTNAIQLQWYVHGQSSFPSVYKQAGICASVVGEYFLQLVFFSSRSNTNTCSLLNLRYAFELSEHGNRGYQIHKFKAPVATDWPAICIPARGFSSKYRPKALSILVLQPC
jgi:hypothetical protein